jgi:hypothetical protein
MKDVGRSAFLAWRVAGRLTINGYERRQNHKVLDDLRPYLRGLEGQESCQVW